jgi:hypothetical protein
MMKQAAQRIQEAMPLYQRFAARYAGSKESSEREALLSMADLARYKLDEARLLYAELQSVSKEPKKFDFKITSLNELIGTLEAELKVSTGRPPK